MKGTFSAGASPQAELFLVRLTPAAIQTPGADLNAMRYQYE